MKRTVIMLLAAVSIGMIFQSDGMCGVLAIVATVITAVCVLVLPVWLFAFIVITLIDDVHTAWYELNPVRLTRECLFSEE